MYTVRKYVEIDAGHRVPFHEAGCRFLHGHRYRVEAVVASEQTINASAGASQSGMVVDFRYIKQALMDTVHARYDHRLILWVKDPYLEVFEKAGDARPLVFDPAGIVTVPCIPTAEELARFWYGMVDAELEKYYPQDPDTGRRAARLVALRVRETPTSVATYTPPSLVC